MSTFVSYLVERDAQGQIHSAIRRVSLDDLSSDEVLIRVHYSSLNYKDALVATGHPGIVHKFPHVPGIDASGIVVSSASPAFQSGDQVLITGYELGVNHWGGYAEYVCVPVDWVVPLPTNLSLKESMILGTAGFTAALCINALEQHGLRPEHGELLVTGASGGVGSIAVVLLAKRGYAVVAMSGKASAHDYLRTLGASRVLNREEIADLSGKSLLKGCWAGAVDTVGGSVLATVLKSTRYNGVVTACGQVAGGELATTVYPFILRGVKLLGIDSVQCPMPQRLEVWQKLASDWKPACLDAMSATIGLDALPDKIEAILQGSIRGRVVVKVADLGPAQADDRDSTTGRSDHAPCA